jgi:hypothetical protein
MSEATPGVRLATPERVPRLAAMMGRAFVEEPMML